MGWITEYRVDRTQNTGWREHRIQGGENTEYRVERTQNTG